jgi:hypothetical protein
MFGNDRMEHSLIQSYVQQTSHLIEYVGFSSDGSQSQVPPKFAQKDIPNLTFSDFPEFQHGLELFNDNALPPSLRSSCLALVAEQEIDSNRPNISSSSLIEQETFVGTGVAYLWPPCYFHFSEAKYSWTVNPSMFGIQRHVGILLLPSLWQVKPTTSIIKPKLAFVAESTDHDILRVPGSKVYSGTPHHPVGQT